MRLATVALVALLCLVHFELWFNRGSGVLRLRELELRLAQQRADNDAARARNDRLLAEVRDLKEGLEMVEERARYELGMLKADEILVQIAAAGSASAAALPVAAPSFVVRPPAAPAQRAASRTTTPTPRRAASGAR